MLNCLSDQLLEDTVNLKKRIAAGSLALGLLAGAGVAVAPAASAAPIYYQSITGSTWANCQNSLNKMMNEYRRMGVNITRQVACASIGNKVYGGGFYYIAP